MLPENVFVTNSFVRLLDGACVHYIMVSKFQWKPFWLATQRDRQNDWTATQNRAKYDVFAQAPFDTLEKREGACTSFVLRRGKLSRSMKKKRPKLSERVALTNLGRTLHQSEELDADNDGSRQSNVTMATIRKGTRANFCARQGGVTSNQAALHSAKTITSTSFHGEISLAMHFQQVFRQTFEVHLALGQSSLLRATTKQ